MRSRTWYREIGELFPKKSEAAPVIWALLVIRSDMLIELEHIGADDAVIERIDPTNLFARNYFFRRSLLSVASATKLLQRLRSTAEFKEMLAADSSRSRRFTEHKQIADRAHKEVTTLRDIAAGHIEGSVIGAVGKIPRDERIQVELTKKGYGSSLASRALLATLFPEHTEEEMGARLDRVSNASFAAVQAINIAVDLFSEKYGWDPP